MQLAIALAIISSVLLPSLEMDLVDGSTFERIAWALAVAIVPLLFAVRLARHIQSRHISSSKDSADFAHQLVSLERLFLITWSLATIVVLGLFRWDLCIRSLPVFRNSIVLTQLVVLLPILGPLVAFWFIVVRLEQKYIARLLGHRPASHWRECITAIWIQSRHMILLPAIPVFAILAIEDSLQLFPELGIYRLLMYATVIAVIPILLPKLIHRLWDVESLPNDSRKRRVELLISRMGVRVAEICLWRTGGRSINAAVAGAFQNSRILLLSDALLDSFDDDDLDAVVAHEMAHVKHRHIQSMLWSLIAAGLVAILSMQIIDPLGWQRVSTSQLSLLIVSIVLSVWVFVHRFIARQFEFHADWEACRFLSNDNPSTHPSNEASVAAMVRMLQKLVPSGVSGSDWWHPSIQARIATLELIHTDTDRRDQLEERITAVYRLVRGTSAFLTLATLGLFLIRV